MQNTYEWKVVPSNQPKVIRSCPKCGNHSEYESSGNFRVNANQSRLDIWLIYQCTKCKNTWNMEILSRISSSTVNKELYEKYLSNDTSLAKQYAFDTITHSRNKSVLNYEDLQYDVLGCCFKPENITEPIQIKVLCDYPMNLRLDKVLSLKLGITREHVKKLENCGMLSSEGIKDIGKAKIRTGMILTLNAPQNIVVDS
ncbi:MAG: DUF1062 domain-containing protein [Mobilitalea sp.]